MEIRTDALLQHPSITATNKNKTSISEKQHCKKSPSQGFSTIQIQNYHLQSASNRRRLPDKPRSPLQCIWVHIICQRSGLTRRATVRGGVTEKEKEAVHFLFNIFFSFPFLNTPPLRARSQKPTSRRPATTESGSLRS